MSGSVDNQDEFITGLGPKFWRMILGCVAGSFFEYYNYGLISYFGDEISTAFFPHHKSGETTLLETFALFGAAYIVRPFGGIFFGWLADTQGRRTALYITLIGMGIPTVIMGCIPTYNSIGYTSTVIIFLLRMLQGLAISGEYSNALLYVYEQCCVTYTPQGNKQIRNVSFGQCLLWCGSTGALLVAIWKILLDNIMEKDDRYNYGWRIPFWFGIVIILVGYCVRQQLPLDTVEHRVHNPINSVFSHLEQFWKPLLILVTVYLTPGLIQAVCIYWLPEYLEDLHEPKDHWSFVGVVLCYIIGFSSMVFVSIFIDRFHETGRFSYLQSGSLLNFIVIIITPILFVLLYYANGPIGLTIFQVVYGIIGFSSLPPMLAFCVVYIEDQNVRSTLITLGYNIQSLHGGLSEEILTAIEEAGGLSGNLYAGLYISLIVIISTISLYYGTKYPYQHKIFLDEDAEDEYQQILDKNDDSNINNENETSNKIYKTDNETGGEHQPI